MTDSVLELDTIFRPTSRSLSPRPPRPSLAPSLPTPTVASSSSVPAVLPSRSSKKECSNCRSRGLWATGHTDETCFQPGGGMEDHQDEYLANKGRVHAMFVECLENALSVSEQVVEPVDPISISPPPDDSQLPIDDTFLPPIANLCVTSLSPNSHVHEDLYYRCDPKFPSFIAYTSTAPQFVALLSLAQHYNALLDSGCTHHIIRDLGLFNNYVVRPVSVGTANCSSLAVLGIGDVDFRFPFGSKIVTFTLRGCLYAPTAPINLLSVGALIEKGLSCLFSPGGITTVSYPHDHPCLPGLTLSATVVNCLSLFKLDFVAAVSPSTLLAFPASVSPPVTPSSPPAVLPLPVSSSLSSFPRLKQDCSGIVALAILAWMLLVLL